MPETRRSISGILRPRAAAALAAAALFVLILGNLPPADAHDGAADAAYLKGYARTVSGPTIGYHSSYPDASSALIIRAGDGKTAIEWESEPVPAGFDAPDATFLWLCGLASQKGAHRFDLAVDGKPAFSFRTAKDASDKAWDLTGSDGSALSFKATLVDQFGELFGFMTLRLPRARLTPGKPLRLRVTSESAGSPDWHMVFQYELKPFLRASAEPALLKGKDGGGPTQIVRFEASRIGPPIGAEIRIDGAAAKAVRLETGYNSFYIPTAAVRAPRRAAVEVRPEGGDAARLDVELKPVARRSLYFLPHSHTDIGYSSHQAKVEKDHWSYLEKAIELASATSAYPEEARFKWNLEVLWPVETYLRQASPERKEAFFQAVRQGRLELQGLLANELTGVCHPEELFELTAYGRALRRDRGLRIESAMITDIPSYSWSIVPALAQAGVKYLSSGPNYMPNLLDGGDRIGGALKAWGDKPFYWVSPSGREKILFWMAGRGYSWFHGLNIGQLNADKGQPVFDYCRELEAKAYPYEIVQVRYTVGGDNGPPDPALPEVVKSWNETFESPRLVIATAGDMFRTFEKRYGAALPLVKGDFTPYWEDGAASSALETALNRRSVVRLLQAEAIWAMRPPKPFPGEAFAEAWRQALLWDEHTWGASDSVSDPDGENARSQWDYKRAFAVEADKRSRGLMTEAVGNGAGDASGAFQVENTLSFARTGVTAAPASLAKRGDRVADAAGRPVPSQRLKDGRLAVLAADVPPFGSRAFTVGPGAPQPPADAPSRVEGNVLTNGLIRAEIDPASGSVRSLRWLARGGEELVDGASMPGLNSYYYVPGYDPKAAQGPEAGLVSIGETGPLVASIIVESAAPGCRGLRREYRLTAGSPRLEIADRIDKTLVRRKEAVHIGFPLRVPDGVLRFDLGWGWIEPGRDQIAGSCLDFFCPQPSADVSNRDWGVTWVTLDAPLAEAGAMTDETRGDRGTRTWRTAWEPTRTIYSYVMNNYWHTNYKADQPGPVDLRYAVEPHAGAGRAAAKKIGLDAEQPLIVRAGGPAAARAVAPSFASPDIVITSLKPAGDGDAVLVRYFNASERLVETEMTLPAGARAFRADADGRPSAAVKGRMSLAPFETGLLRLEFGRRSG